MKKFLKITVITLLSLLAAVIIIPVAAGVVLYQTADFKEPTISADTTLVHREQHVGYRSYAGSKLRQSDSGLWEIYVEGSAVERGMAVGSLCQELMCYQEDAFVSRIREFVPSERYLKFLRYMLGIFNRRLGDHISDEYREEVYGIAQYCSHDYDDIAGPPYVRQLNYQGAHDIGHAMQDYMLVGCSSFAAWDERSSDSTLIIGRNFDFFMSDDFAKNKLVTFCRPDSGYRYAAVSWAGMVGIVSGMNERGITVTINAAKSQIPTSAATPIAVIAREILQYAATIDEAYAIASRSRAFVSESLLIGSGSERKAAIIEISPEQVALVMPKAHQIISTNHFQSADFAQDARNIENIRSSDSPVRYRRLEELLDEKAPITPEKTVEILRERRGPNNEALGFFNELALAQLIAHHSVIFKPEEGIMWVSTSPWQLGRFMAYDLKKIFAETPDFSGEIYDASRTIAADTLLASPHYDDLVYFRTESQAIQRAIGQHQSVDQASLARFTASNPDYFHGYNIVGNYYKAQQQPDSALHYWQQALQRPMKLAEREHIEAKISELKRK